MRVLAVVFITFFGAANAVLADFSVDFNAMPVGTKVYYSKGNKPHTIHQYTKKTSTGHVVDPKGNLLRTVRFNKKGQPVSRTSKDGFVYEYIPFRCRRQIGTCKHVEKRSDGKVFNMTTKTKKTKDGLAISVRWVRNGKSGSIPTIRYKYGEYNLAAFWKDRGNTYRLTKIVKP